MARYTKGSLLVEFGYDVLKEDAEKLLNQLGLKHNTELWWSDGPKYVEVKVPIGEETTWKKRLLKLEKVAHVQRQVLYSIPRGNRR